MKNCKISPLVFMLVVIGLTIWTPSSQFTAAADINWNKYMQSAATVAAIAAAMATLGHCSKKLKIEETNSGGMIGLVFTCDANEEEEASSIIFFERFGDGPLMPKKYMFAG